MLVECVNNTESNRKKEIKLERKILRVESICY